MNTPNLLRLSFSQIFDRSLSVSPTLALYNIQNQTRGFVFQRIVSISSAEFSGIELLIFLEAEAKRDENQPSLIAQYSSKDAGMQCPPTQFRACVCEIPFRSRYGKYFFVYPILGSTMAAH